MSTAIDIPEKAGQHHDVGAGEKPRSRSRYVFLGAILLLLFVFPVTTFFVGGINYYLHLALYIFMYTAMASSWNILGGYTGYVSLGHSVFFGVGAYVSSMLLLKAGLLVFVSAPLAGLIAMLIGFLVGFITLRVRGPAFIISTIALLLMVRLSVDNWRFVGSSSGLSLPLFPLPVQFVKVPFYYGLLIAAIGAVYLSYRVKHSKLGLGLRAISQDEVKAESAGIPTNFYKIAAFALSTFFVGAAGAMWGQYLTYIRPNIVFLIVISANMVLMSILGGKGTITGPIIGAILLILIEELVISNFGSSQLHLTFTGIVMILVLLFFPEGIVGTLKKAGRLPGILDWE